MKTLITWLLKLMGILAALVVLVTAIAVIATWQPDIPVDQLKAKYAPPPSQFLALDGMQVHYRDEGPRTDAEPIILVHGTSASLHTFDGWTAELAKTRRVIRFDTPGFGLTGPNATGDYSIAMYARFVVGMMDALKVDKAVLAGNSLGGEIAWATAVAYPARVTKLGLIDAAGYPFIPKSIPIGFRIARTPVLRDLIQYTLPRGVVEASIRNVMGNPAKATPELVTRYYDLTAREGNRKAVGRRFKHLEAEQLRAQDYVKIKGIKQPTLIMWGGQDRLIPPENGKRFEADIAGSQHVVFDDLGHVPHEEDPARTVAAFVAFLGKAR
jgi:pimeloyl-ACP methyl ester carboxylesterase